MDYRTGLIIVGAIWLSGALITAGLQFALVHHWDRRDGDRGTNAFIAAVAMIAINLFLWPIVFQSVWVWYGPRFAVILRLKPKWTIEEGKEKAVRDWRLKDGTDVKGEAICYESGEPTHFQVTCNHDRVDYRVRMIAPHQQPATKWVAMERPSKEEWLEETRELREAGEYYDESPAFGSERQLDPGKYQVEFRVRLPSGELEELSGVTLVVT